MKDEGYSSGTMLVSFLLGGIVGAGLALLLVPQSGARTVKKISDFSNVKDRTSDYVENTKDKITSYDSGG
ncbi:MAG: YtxH domain-containing protein [Thermodesulfovibrionales bacterium]